MTFDRAMFALSVSDAMDGASVRESVGRISDLASKYRSLGAICVRDDAMDGGMLASAAKVAERSGLAVILESDVAENLEAAVWTLNARPLLVSPYGDQSRLARTAAELGCPVALSSTDLGDLMGLAAVAEGAGCREIVLNPQVRSMKQCLETTVAALRMAARDPSADLPLMVRAWSGEYALAVASVFFLRGGRLAVLDDLDPQCCSVLDSLVRGFTER